jgi:hypothetical protein
MLLSSLNVCATCPRLDGGATRGFVTYQDNGAAVDDPVMTALDALAPMARALVSITVFGHSCSSASVVGRSTHD